MAKKGRPFGTKGVWWTTKKRVVLEMYNLLSADRQRLRALATEINNEAKRRATGVAK